MTNEHEALTPAEAGRVADALETLAGLDEGEHTDYDDLLALAQKVRPPKERTTYEVSVIGAGAVATVEADTVLEAHSIYSESQDFARLDEMTPQERDDVGYVEHFDGLFATVPFGNVELIAVPSGPGGMTQEDALAAILQEAIQVGEVLASSLDDREARALRILVAEAKKNGLSRRVSADPASPIYSGGFADTLATFQREVNS